MASKNKSGNKVFNALQKFLDAKYIHNKNKLRAKSESRECFERYNWLQERSKSHKVGDFEVFQADEYSYTIIFYGEDGPIVKSKVGNITENGKPGFQVRYMGYIRNFLNGNPCYVDTDCKYISYDKNSTRMNKMCNTNVYRGGSFVNISEGLEEDGIETFAHDLCREKFDKCRFEYAGSPSDYEMLR